MKKRLAVGGVVLSLLAILGIGTAAYFVTDGTAQNQITMGKVALTLTETVNGKVVDENNYKLDGVMPGQTVAQVASIENTGGQPYWLRVKMDVQIIGKDGASLPNSVENAYGVEVPVISFNTSTAAPLDGEQPTGNWVEKDGWYYYPGPVKDKETVNPFTEVTFAAEAGNEYQGCTVNIRVDAQAVQVKNNDPTETGGTVLDVQGWPNDGTDSGFDVEPEEPTEDPEEPTTPVEPEEPTTEPVTP